MQDFFVALGYLLLSALYWGLCSLMAAIFLCVPLAFVMHDAGQLLSPRFRLDYAVMEAFWLILKVSAGLFGLLVVTGISLAFDNDE